ncbi:Fructosamine kinase domain containing protein [Rhypophila sp. PSN 637]
MARTSLKLDLALDKVLLSNLPKDGKVIQVHKLGLSEWCDTTRYDVELPTGEISRFFEKRAYGPDGAELIAGHWHSESSIYKFIPEFFPRPIATGTYESNPDAHFFLMEFEDMIDDVIPGPETYMAAPVALQLRSLGKSPTGKFGFRVVTRFANLSQQNDWDLSWEVWWTKHTNFILQREEKIRGPYSEEDAKTKQEYVDRVLPRYLRPLETNGRSIQPALCHTELWPGNVKYRLDNVSPLVSDSNALWAHGEAELGLIRNPRYPLGKAFIEEYLNKIPISEPEEDFDSRNIIYLLRHQICLASVYPNEVKLRDVFLDNMRLLINRLNNEEREQKVA